MTAADDFALLRAWRQGDEAAANELSTRHYASVLRFFEVKASNLAEDLTQRTFLACVEALDRVASTSSFRAYLFGIARNQLLMHLRKQTRRDELSRFDTPATPSMKTSVSMLVARHEEQLLLVRALVELPTEHQMLLQLYYWDGLTTTEIAVVFGIPASTVAGRLSRARQLLGEQITALPAAPASRASLMADLERWTRSVGGQ